MKKALKFILLGLLAFGIIYTFVYLYNKSKPIPEVFEIVKVERKDIVQKSVATGSVVPRNETEIRPRVSGIIEELYVKAGQIVNKGDKIAKIRIIPDMERLSSAEARVKKAAVSVEEALDVFKRTKQLYNDSIVPFSEYLKAQTSLKMNREELSAAEDNLQIIKKGISKNSAKATNTIVLATIAGMVLDVPVEVGYSVIEMNTFNAGTTIASIADMKDMIFEGKIDETEVGKIKIGMPLVLTIGAISDEKYDAVLTYISPKGVEENGIIQFEIEAEVTLKKNNFLRAGYSANADIVLSKRDSVIAVEEKNILFEGDSTFVEIAKDTATFTKVPVKLGLSDGIFAEVLSGVKEGITIKVQK